MFESKNLYYYVFAFSVIAISGYFAKKFKSKFEDNNDEYELIKKYLLNDSPLYGYNKPKIWIHTKYETNARKWKSFYSRTSTDLNEPYIHLTIKTIINHCSNDFNVCLIDDDTFSKLIPSWDIEISQVAEPMKHRLRELGLLQLVYYYGGMVVPNSFVCLRNLKSLYDEGTQGNRPFVCENINRTLDIANKTNNLLFVPDLNFFGAPKNNETLKSLIEYLKKKNRTPHFSSESDFLGDSAHWCLTAIMRHEMTLIGGELIGVKTQKRKAILLDDLMEENFLDLNTSIYGIYIPNEELLRRHKYKWFAVINESMLMNSSSIICKYLKASIVDTTSEYSSPSSQIRSVVSL
jgi:hypothetical protein